MEKKGVLHVLRLQGRDVEVGRAPFFPQPKRYGDAALGRLSLGRDTPEIPVENKKKNRKGGTEEKGENGINCYTIIGTTGETLTLPVRGCPTPCG